MFWGAISYSGVISIYELKGKFDSFAFSNFLKFTGLPAIEKKVGKNFIFQQDNARPHLGDTLVLLQKSKINYLEWPPQSPDINPIEQIWMLIEKYIRPKVFDTKEELVNCVRDCFNRIETKIVQKFIDDLYRRYEWIEQNEGDIFNA